MRTDVEETSRLERKAAALKANLARCRRLFEQARKMDRAAAGELRRRRRAKRG